MALLNIENLKKYADVKYNVLLTGRHGVGKTAIIKEIFDEKYGPMNENWLYFSTPTLAPDLDLIGIPQNYKNAHGEEVFRIIPPEHFTANHKIKALFFDEINRADDMVLNRIMELLQFKSINGRKFPHLEVVWAAENPGDENEYAVRDLDPAQRDRFHIQINVPYDMDKEFFTNKFGEEIFNVAKSWWTTKDNKQHISPRKMDSILEGHMLGFDILDFNNKVNLTELRNSLATIGDLVSIRNVARSGNVDKIKSYFNIDKLRQNEAIIKAAKNNYEIFDSIYPHMDGETKNYISSNFAYSYVEDRKNANSFNKDQLAFFVKNANTEINMSDKDNVETVINHMIETAKLFEYQDIVTNPMIGLEEIKAICPFTFDSSLHASEFIPKYYHDYVKGKVDTSLLLKYLQIHIMVADWYVMNGMTDKVEELDECIYGFYENIYGSVVLQADVVKRDAIHKSLENNERVDQTLVSGILYIRK